MPPPSSLKKKPKTQTGTREASESRGQREKWREDGEEGDRRYVLRGEESGGRRLRVAVKSCLPIAAVFMQPPKRSINSQLLERGSDYWVVLERDKRVCSVQVKEKEERAGKFKESERGRRWKNNERSAPLSGKLC